MEIDIFTLFPEWFEWLGTQRHVRNALDGGSRLQLRQLPRAHPAQRRPGRRHALRGGAGMVLRVDVMDARSASPLRHRRDAGAHASPVIALAPGGRLLDESYVQELAGEPALTLLCGRYEGFDERIVEHLASETLSIGRYVLSGGELGGDGGLRRRLAQAPGCARARRLGRRGVLQRGPWRAIPSIRTTRDRPSIAAGASRDPAFRSPRAYPRVALEQVAQRASRAGARTPSSRFLGPHVGSRLGMPAAPVRLADW